MAAVFTQGGTFAVNMFTANILGREVFGRYALVQSTILTASVLAQVATGYTATKYLAEFRSTDADRAGRILGLCTMVAASMAVLAFVFLMGFAPMIAGRVLRRPDLVVALRIAAVALPFSVMNGMLLGALAGFEGFRAMARAGIATGTLNVLFCALGAHRFGLHGAIAGLACAAAAQFCVLTFILRVVCREQGVAPRFTVAWTERSIIVRFALPAAMGGLSTMPSIWIANAFLSRQTDGLAQVALYAVATSFRVLVMFVPQLLNSVGLSILNNQRGLGDARRYARVFWTNLGLVVTMAILGAAALALLAPIALRFFGKSFDQGTPVLLILLIATLPEAIGVAVYQILQSQEKMWLSLFAVALPRDISFVLMAYVLAAKLGARGLALAHLAGTTLACVVVVILAARIGLQIRTPSSLVANPGKTS